MISFAVDNPIDLYNCCLDNLNDDAKCACLSRMGGCLPTWDDEITDSKGLFLDSHEGLCPVDKKIWREKPCLILRYALFYRNHALELVNRKPLRVVSEEAKG